MIQPPSTCWLVADYLPGGTLADWLYGKGGRGGAPKRSLHEKVTMGLGIARGMLVRVDVVFTHLGSQLHLLTVGRGGNMYCLFFLPQSKPPHQSGLTYGLQRPCSKGEYD